MTTSMGRCLRMGVTLIRSDGGCGPSAAIARHGDDGQQKDLFKVEVKATNQVNVDIGRHRSPDNICRPTEGRR